MRRIRGRFLTAIQESIVVRRARPQRREGEGEFLYPLGESPIQAIILPYRGNADLEDYVVQNFRFVCNLSPPEPAVRIADEVIRFAGTDREAILTVTEVTTLLEVQQLVLEENENPLV